MEITAIRTDLAIAGGGAMQKAARTQALDVHGANAACGTRRLARECLQRDAIQWPLERV